MPLPRIRCVPTASGATAVQVIWRYVNNKPVIDHIGSAHSDQELAVLRARAQQLIDGSQMALDLGISDTSDRPATGSKDDPLTVIGQRAGCLLDAIRGAFVALGLDAATGGDRVFYDLVTARIIHPGSQADSIETLAEVGGGITLVQHDPAGFARLCYPRVLRPGKPCVC